MTQAEFDKAITNLQALIERRERDHAHVVSLLREADRRLQRADRVIQCHIPLCDFVKRIEAMARGDIPALSEDLVAALEELDTKLRDCLDNHDAVGDFWRACIDEFGGAGGNDS